MTLVKEVKVNTIEDVLSELRWMNDNNICGDFKFIPEDKDDEELINFVKLYYG